MSSNTVSLCMIVKDEIRNIPILLSQVLPILEEVVIVDTGSTDGTRELLEKMEREHANLQVKSFKWVDDFSAARNYAFSFATKDWVFWLDSDDQIDPTQLKIFKQKVLNNPKVDCWILDYVYSRFANGKPQTVLGRERFVRRSKQPKWMNAIHETIDIAGCRQEHYDALKVIHHRGHKPNADPLRNIRILAKEYIRNHRDPRTAYYYGKELFDHLDPKGIEVMERYLELPSKYWDDEINARERLAKHYLSEKRHTEALKVAEPIYHLDATRKRAGYYWTFGAVEQDLGNYEIAIEWYKRCLVDPPPSPRVLNLEYYTWNPMRRIAECYWALGCYTEALKYAAEVRERLPDDPGTLAWIRSLKIDLRPPSGHSLVVIEFGTRLRTDSHLDPWDLDSVAFPVPDASVDGIVLKHTGQFRPEMERIVKPGGFLWAVYQDNALPPSSSFQSLGEANHKGTMVTNYIRVDPSKPSIGIADGDNDFGPYRIRLGNLKKALVKKGYPIVNLATARTDIVISNNLNAYRHHSSKGFQILDVCEQLPSYDSFGIQHAQVVNTSSTSLAKHVRDLHPGLKVITVEDAFEMTQEDWL